MGHDDIDRLCWSLPLRNGGDCCDCMTEAEHRQRCDGEDAATDGEGDRP